jgi:hypothetical protein
MTFLSYALAVAVVFSAPFIGAFLALHTKEEMPTARKYFPLAQNLLLLLLVAVVLDSFGVALTLRILAYVLTLAALALLPPVNAYPLFAFAFFLVFGMQEALFAVSALVFLYGLPAGSMLAVRMKSKRIGDILVPVAVRYSGFGVVALLLGAIR